MNETAITIAELLINIFRLYLIAGLIFSIIFVLFGIGKVDESAHWQLSFWGIINGIGFRILILPGLCAFWVLFALRLVRGKSKPIERNAHRILAKE